MKDEKMRDEQTCLLSFCLLKSEDRFLIQILKILVYLCFHQKTIMRYLLFLFFSISIFGQQTSKVDFINCKASVQPDASEKSISGKIIYEFKVNSTIDTIKIDAIKMTFMEVKINGKIVNFKNSGKELQLFEGFKTGNNKLIFNYKATPKQALYFIGATDFDCHMCSHKTGQIWTQGQGKYTSHWLPSFDDVNEKVIFNLDIVFEKGNEVISNGKLFKNDFVDDKNLQTWQYRMKKPISSYLLMIAIGNFYSKKFKSKSGIPLQLYLEKDDFPKFNATYIYSKEIFDFLEAKIGVRYPWEIYKQVPVRDFLYAGMENASATIFSKDFVVDPIGYNDKNYVNVNAHELAHQWFGNLITAKSGKHHWLQEGFATYYALLAEKTIFGEDYFYNKLFESSLQLEEASKTDLIPILNEKASSLTFYQKGALALFYLENEIGEKNFAKAVKAFLKKYQFNNVETDDFLNEVKKVSDFDTVKFKIDWLESSKFENKIINELLIKNKSIEKLIEIIKLRNTTLSDKKEFFENILKSEYSSNCKQEIVYQLAQEKFEDKKNLLKLALQTNDLKVRQAVAETLIEIPLEFKTDYESLLNDASYETKKLALIGLVKNFPENKDYYRILEPISKTNGDFRITFLSLFLLDEKANFESKKMYWKELVDFTSINFESSVRQSALVNALVINSKNETVLRNLVNGTLSPKWQFSKFCRDKIRLLIKSEEHVKIFKSMQNSFSVEEELNLQKLL